MLLGKLLLHKKLQWPLGTMLLLACCFAATLPMYLDPGLYFVLGGDAPVHRWWQPLVAQFVHGGGWPGPTAHLLANSLILLMGGSLIERVLGPARFLLLSLCCFLMFGLFMWRTHYPANGFSAVTFSYWLVLAAALQRAWRIERWQMLTDPLSTLGAVVLLFLIAGAPKLTHAVAVLMSVPFAIAWWDIIQKNLQQIEQGIDFGSLDTGRPDANRFALIAVVLLLGFEVTMAAGAMLGLIT